MQIGREARELKELNSVPVLLDTPDCLARSALSATFVATVRVAVNLNVWLVSAMGTRPHAIHMTWPPAAFVCTTRWAPSAKAALLVTTETLGLASRMLARNVAAL